ncbi:MULTISPECIES: hypothetical protein [unclassified Bradyrhizobium]|uniref:hypothetical protein n=1 Tax=unclassified Bradyrhizobium TaxID=2631580 RepID=UPI00247A908B|nr:MULTISPECIES: hypothetical protein [unclassified Bradyrhizobium]WGS23656.1 hypothetical protein MTX22_19775 [Bradyrhizobium sp. ISRA463]WGS30682.1 hypothetical protein MTX19_17480 [Bradyrhizobium sp. ISRA464]
MVSEPSLIVVHKEGTYRSSRTPQSVDAWTAAASPTAKGLLSAAANSNQSLAKRDELPGALGARPALLAPNARRQELSRDWISFRAWCLSLQQCVDVLDRNQGARAFGGGQQRRGAKHVNSILKASSRSVDSNRR